MKLDVTTILQGPNDAEGYDPIPDGPDAKKSLTFKGVAFGSLIRAKFDEETDDQRFHRIFLAQRIHESKGELELEESDRLLVKKAIAQVQKDSPWIMYVCWCILEGKPQTQTVEPVQG